MATPSALEARWQLYRLLGEPFRLRLARHGTGSALIEFLFQRLQGAGRGREFLLVRMMLADADVELRDYFDEATRLAVKTNASGEFRFARVPFGWFWMSARKPGGVAAQRQVNLDASHPDVTDVRLTLWSARSIHGTVVDAGV